MYGVLEAGKNGPCVYGPYRIERIDASNGNSIWVWTYSGGYVGHRPQASEDGTIYVRGSHSLTALDGDTGKRLWFYEYKHAVWTCAGMTESGPRVCVTFGDNALVVLDGRTGKEVWTAEEDKAGYSSLLVDNGKAFVGRADGFEVLALEDAGKLWRYPANVGAGWPYFAVSRGILYCGIGNTLYAFDAATGQEKWQFTADAEIAGSPCARGGQVCFVTRDGWLYAVAVEPEVIEGAAK